MPSDMELYVEEQDIEEEDSKEKNQEDLLK